MVYFLAKKTHIVCYFLGYVMQFMNLLNDKSGATSQLGYIPLSLYRQIC